MKGRLKSIIFILVLGSVCTAILLGMKNYTLPKIEHYQQLRLKANILEAADVDYSESNLDDLFAKNIKKIEQESLTYYLSPDNLYISIFQGRGLWGMIEGVITLDSDLETIKSLRIISQEETPGLGGRISEKEFLNQFKGKKVSPKLYLALRKKAVRINEVDSITGASMTSQALIDMINEHVIDFREQIKDY